MSDLLSVIVRTMPGREAFVDRCLFVLANQEYSPLEVVVAVQKRAADESLETLTQVIQRWQGAFERVIVVDHASASDARAKSLNLGKNACSGVFFAILDDDDKVYPEHYVKLLTALDKSGHRWGYADTVQTLYDAQGRLTGRALPFKRSRFSFLNHLRENTIPIHSFVIQTQAAREVGDFDESLSRLEDYDYLIRLAIKHEPLYLPEIGVEYCIRGDGSNTVVDGTYQEKDRVEKQRLWRDANETLARKRVSYLGWWVQELLDVAGAMPQPLSGPALAIAPQHSIAFPGGNIDVSDSSSDRNRKALAAYYASTSWRLSRPIRNLSRRLRGQPPEFPVIPDSEAAAAADIERLLRSTSWELTAPIRLLRRIFR